MKSNKNITDLIAEGVLLTSLLLAGCGFQAYQAKPITPTQTASVYREHDPQGLEFQAYLLDQGYSPDELPLKQWGLRELIYTSLFFHPSLNVSRAQWRAARAAEITAAQRPLPGISANTENHSDTSDSSSPWTMGLAIDVPIETGGKRQARIDRANSLSEAARLDIAQSAWTLRNQVVQSWLDYNNTALQIEILSAEAALRDDIVNMLEKRLDAGMSSSIEVANARLLRQKTQQLLDTEIARKPELLSALAAATGLSSTSLQKLDLRLLDYADLSSQLIDDKTHAAISAQAQEEAMLNRLDLRAALSRYAAAEAKLRLEIARQYPDLVLSPGYSYDQGDKVWSLGISALLTAIHKNRGLIAEATALREVEAAQFTALQANIISNLDKSKQRLFAAFQELDKVRDYKTALDRRLAQTQQQYDAGYADRLELASTRLENVIAKQNILATAIKSRRALAALEDAMQRPLDESMTIPNNLEKAGNPASPAGR